MRVPSSGGWQYIHSETRWELPPPKEHSSRRSSYISLLIIASPLHLETTDISLSVCYYFESVSTSGRMESLPYYIKPGRIDVGELMAIVEYVRGFSSRQPLKGRDGHMHWIGCAPG